MPTIKALCLALGAQAAIALRRSAGKALAGIPIRNYRYRHLQADILKPGSDAFDWVLKFKDGADDADIAMLCGDHCRAFGHPSEGGVPFATVRSTEAQLENILNRHPSVVEWIEPDTPVELEPEQDDEMQVDVPWGHNTIGLEQTGFTGDGVHIYVMDTGVRVSHEDFEGRAIPTIDTVAGGGTVKECNGESTCARDMDGHGTHVAGTAGGKVYGVAKKATLHAMKVCCLWGTNILGGIDWVAQKRTLPAVMTMSLGSYSTPESSRVAVDAVVAAGVTVTVSAGNRDYPSCQKSYTFIRSAIGVSASDSTNARSTYSNYGECNAIFAPGSSIVSASHGSDTGSRTKSGTSMATPMVAGVAALLLEESSGRTPEDIRRELRGRAQAGALSGLKEGDPNLLLWAGFR